MDQFSSNDGAASENTVSNEALETAMNEKAVEEGQNAEENQQLEEPQQEVEKNDEFASKFAALSRKEKALRAREAEMEQRYQDLEAKFKALEEQSQPKEPEEEPIDRLLRKNPLKALEKYGWDYNKLTQMQLEDGNLPTDIQMQIMREELENKYEDELKKLREEIETDKQSREEEKYNQVINNFMNELTDFVSEGGDDYELIRANDAIELVYDVIEEHYNSSGRILDKKEAADQVEAYLQEELQKVLKSSKKLGSLLQPKEEPVSEQRQSQPTLSNAHAATASPKAERKLSDDESKLKAASLIRWGD